MTTSPPPTTSSAPSITATRIDFSTAFPTGEYNHCFALLLSNVLSASETSSFLALAQSEAQWQDFAPTHPDSGTPTRHEGGFRKCQRILRNDAETSKMMFDRVKPFLEAEGLGKITPESEWAHIVNKQAMQWSKARAETGYWKLVGLNPMLRLLRYGSGNYFRPHCDRLFQYNQTEPVCKSFLTFHVYLNDDDGLDGGATRFWTPDKKQWIDVEPKRGQVLVFQQMLLLHSGEEVTKGFKYTARTDVMFERVTETREDRKRAKAVADEQG